MNELKNKLVVFVMGPTAVGKTSVSITLAKHFNCEIISADSRQFYREMNIGTAKPTPNQLKEVPHHFINSLSIEEEYNVSDFENDVLAKTEELFKTRDLIIVVGGSGLYQHAIWQGIDEEIPASDPELRKELNTLFEKEGIDVLKKKLRDLDPETYYNIDLQNHVRIIRAIEVCLSSNQTYSSLKVARKADRPFKMLKIGLNTDRKELHQRINIRVDEMMSAGLLEEAKNLYPSRSKNALRTVGYRELFRYFDGEMSLEDAVEKIKVNTRRYAKRQMTWYRRYEDIHWFEAGDTEKIIQLITSF
jgi:tRNA dimethylallyltransferase